MVSEELLSLAADALVLLHVVAIGFIVFGGLLVFRWPWVAWLHLPAAAWGVLLEFKGWICPLTPWEQALRRAAGEAGYRGGFVEHYLLPLIYPEQLPRELQWFFGSIVLLVNLAVYGAWWLRRRRIS